MRQRSDYPIFSDAELERRHKAVYALMEQEGVDAALFYGSGRYASDIYWLSDWPSSREAYLLMQNGQRAGDFDAAFQSLSDGARHVGDQRRALGAAPTQPTALSISSASAVWNRRRSAWSARSLIRSTTKLREKYPSATFVDLSGKLRMMRTVRSADEIERIRLASKLTDQSIQALAEGLRPGMREDEIPAIIEPVYLKAGGYAGIHFMSSMPMRDPDFPVPSQFHSKRKLQKGDALITEISGAYSGYSGQIHRTFSLGEGPTPEWQKMHDAALEGFEVLARVIKDGATTTEAEEAAEVIHERGFSTYDDVVHGVNQYPPIFQTKTRRRHDSREMVFRENMVIVIQPNLMTHDEKMGLQFGETLVVKKHGCESLNAYPRRWVTCAG